MMDKMSAKSSILLTQDKSVKEQAKVPAHLLARNGARVHEPAAPEPLSTAQLDLAVSRFEALMNQLNGGQVTSRTNSRNRAGNRKAHTANPPRPQKGPKKASAAEA